MSSRLQAEGFACRDIPPEGGTTCSFLEEVVFMQEARAVQPAPINLFSPEAVMRQYGLTRLPTQDELPYSDGEPMETNYHVLQMYLLIDTLNAYWKDREDVFVGGNMFVYFSPTQSRTEDYRGPDFFVVQGVKQRRRYSWVVWEEGKAPDLVIELLSDTTAHKDRNEKKLVYQDKLRVPEYFLFDPLNGEFEGFRLRDGVYEPIQSDGQGRLMSEQCQLALVPRNGVFNKQNWLWLRWETLSGELLATAEERSQQALDAIRNTAERNAQLEAELAAYRKQFGALPQ
jgi:Uma2 family endonuclease